MASVLSKLRPSSTVADALKAYRDLQSLPAGKLAADPYLREACANGKTDPAKLRKLDERLAAGPHDEEWELIELFLQGAGNAVRNICADPPRTNLHTLLGPGSDPHAFVSVLVAAQMCGTTILELVALAVWRTVRDHPESFGPRTLPAAEFDRKQAESRERFAAACATIDAAVEFVPETPDGRGRQYYLWQGERTPVVAYGDDSRERLVQWILRV